jgi:ABC-type cobalamin/Fe3+-siderophores transport system ATPase subunit
MTEFPRGSEWRKWDLHVHAPGTQLNDGYGGGSQENWDRYCAMLAFSDVAVFGITDYFSLDGYFECVEHFRRLYPDSPKVFFPNLELRLNETVNGDTEHVDLHLLLRPDIDRAAGDRLLREMKTELADPDSGRKLSCADLGDRKQLESATVTRESVERALEATFGSELPRTDNVLLIVPSNNSGIRASSGAKRKASIADAIDRMAHAIFGSAANSEYFLGRDRAEDGSSVAAKPVFSGCDAHSFDQLAAWLGKEVTVPETRKSVTWVKSDPTFEGLLQTLAEPQARVRIQSTRPDPKEPYKYISAVRFSGTPDFPDEVLLNQNLVSIIGSRSSGKSALLAYIAHAIDPEYTLAQQLAAEPTATAKTIGPAKGKTWDSVAEINCTIEWGEPSAKAGRMIYIPQNSLFAISERPEEITAKIQPTLYRLDPEFAAAHRQMELDTQTANAQIRSATAEWFRLSGSLQSTEQTLRGLGDRAGVEQTRDALAEQIAKLRAASSLAANEIDEYQKLVDQRAVIAARLRVIEADSERLAPHLTTDTDGAYVARPSVGVDVRPLPAIPELPEGLQAEVAELVTEAATALASSVRVALANYQQSLDAEAEALRATDAAIRSDNAELIEKNRANVEIDALVTSKKKQDEVLEQITAKEADVAELIDERARQAGLIGDALASRAASIDLLEGTFASKQRVLDPMEFGLEREFSADQIELLSERVNRRDRGPFVERDSSVIKVEQCQQSPADFLDALLTKEQKVRIGQNLDEFAADVLATTPELRLYAQIEGDRVGGFSPSSMTPGKQALFALTLILNESEEAWPLLIDQPEDDLDSRSIYGVLVAYLAARKAERQIIMVSHNANLVIGADSEQVIVANRHGVDRQNVGGQAFDYFTGSLEHTRPRTESAVVFEVGGIREHACDILDGGEDAFRKRKEKYKI